MTDNVTVAESRNQKFDKFIVTALNDNVIFKLCSQKPLNKALLIDRLADIAVTCNIKADAQFLTEVEKINFNEILDLAEVVKADNVAGT